ncbi:MAG TPA: type I methionyl aminopeptidase [Anaerolineales bacterium]|nr:type I methionyl aminopeptidase [Anaerolineales bacterium]
MTWRRGIEIKNAAELERMRQAGRVNAEALLAAVAVVRPGVTTSEIDQAAAEILRRHGATPAFLGYPGPTPYPAVTTVSVNEELVHGIPGRRRLKEGDIVSIDCGAIVEGFVGDSAVTVPVGEIPPEAWRLLEATLAGLWAGVGEMKVGRRTGDVSAAIQQAVEGRGFNVTKDYTGHGVGRAMHEDPQVPNYGVAGKGLLLRPGMTIALEPMVLAGGSETRVLDDGWTVVSRDGRRTAHFEHSVAVTAGGPVMLTTLEDPRLDGPRASWYNNFFAGRPSLAEAQGVLTS